MFRYDEFRRPSFWQVDVNFAKTTPITDNVRFQVRLEAFNLFNSPMYDERNYNTDTNVGGLRPHQPQHHRSVELPALHPAGIPTDLLSSRGRERRLGGVPGSTLKTAQGSRLKAQAKPSRTHSNDLA